MQFLLITAAAASLSDAEVAENAGDNGIGHGFAGDLAQCGNRALGVHHDRVRRHTGLRRIQRCFTAFGSTRQRRRLSCVSDERTVKRTVAQTHGSRDKIEQLIQSVTGFRRKRHDMQEVLFQQLFIQLLRQIDLVHNRDRAVACRACQHEHILVADGLGAIKHSQDERGSRSLRHRPVNARLLDRIVRVAQTGGVGHAKQNLSDLDILPRRIDSRKKAMKGDKKLAGEVEFLERLAGEMENGKTARSVEISEEEQEYLKDVSLLTIKPVIYACNMGENDFIDGIDNNKYYKAVEEIAKAEGAETLPICAEMEAEIAQLDDEEKAMFLADMGLEKSGLDRLIKKSYSLLGLISYLTAGKPEVRAWTIKKGTKAPQAAGKIHTDFERGFIRAEVVSFDDLMACGSMAAAKEKGLVRSEGKEYVMKDGDIVLFRFNV